MSDARLRELERRWQKTGAQNDRVVYLRERLLSNGGEQSPALIRALDDSFYRQSSTAIGALEDALALGFTPDAQEVYELVVPEAKGFYIEDAGDVWRFHNTVFQGERFVEELTKQPLSEGYVTQEYIIPRLEGDPRQLPNAQRLYNLIVHLYRNQNCPVPSQHTQIEQARSGMEALTWLITSTAAHYEPSGDDLVVHDWYPRMSDEEIQRTGIRTPLTGRPYQTQITQDSGLGHQMNAIVGSKYLNQIAKTLLWCFPGDGPYLWRRRNIPRQRAKRAVVLGRNVNDDDRVGIGAANIRYAYDYGVALGWSAQRKKFSS